MAMNEHLAKLTKLQHEYAGELRKAQEFENPDISLDGLDMNARKSFSDRANEPFRKERVEGVQAAYKKKLASLTDDFNQEAERAKNAGRDAIPAAPAETSAQWAKVKMLLDAGKNLHQVVASADPGMLHAIKEWGPTYLQAENTKGKPATLAGGGQDAAVDPAHLERSITQRWCKVLDDDSAGRITGGLDAAVTAAQFERSAQHLEAKFAGSNRGVSDLRAAADAHYAGENAALDLGAHESQTTQKDDVA